MNQIVDTLAREGASLDKSALRQSGPAAVLVAVDFSNGSEAALRWAYDYARAIGAPLEILHVIHDPAESPGSYKSDDADPLEPMADIAARRLVEFVGRVARHDPQITGLEAAGRICIEGLPASKILEVAQARAARLLVLGGRRRNGLDRLVHGSTAAHVLRKARLPVTIVKADD